MGPGKWVKLIILLKDLYEKINDLINIDIQPVPFQTFSSIQYSCPACPVGSDYRTGVEFTCDSGAYSSGAEFHQPKIERQKIIFIAPLDMITN